MSPFELMIPSVTDFNNTPILATETKGANLSIKFQIFNSQVCTLYP